jgi:hypothetical protein
MSKEDNPKNDTNISSSGEKVRYLPFYAPPAHPDDDTIDLVELVQTLWKRRKLIIIITLLSLLGAGTYVVGLHFFGKKVYETEIVYQVRYGDASKLPGYLRTREFLSYFVEQEKLTPLILADIYDASDQTYQLPEAVAHDLSPAELAASRLMGDEKNPTFKLGDQGGDYKILTVEYPDPVLVARLANRVLYWLEDFLRAALIKSAEISLQSSNSTAELLGLETQIPPQDFALPRINQNVLSDLQERLIYKEMQLNLLERINPQSEEIPFLKAEVSTIQERLPSLAKGGSRRESVEKEPETVAGVRIQLARLQTHLDRLSDREQPLFDVVDRAIVPSEPNNSPRAVLILALAGIVGFFGSIFLVFLIDFIQKMREQHLAKES